MIKLLTTTFALFWCVISVAHASSPASLAEMAARVDTLEYQAQKRGLPLPPMPIPAAEERLQVAQSASDLAVRVDRLEAQMRQYNGQVEELNFHIRQLQEQLRRFQEDSEFRFQDLEKGKTRRKSSSNTDVNKPATQQFEQLGTPPQTLGSLNQNQLPADQGLAGNDPTLIQPESGPIDLSSMLGGSVSGPAQPDNLGQSSSLTGDPATDYDVAYSQVLQGNYKAAESAFRQFVAAYAQDRLAPNAHYWIGESRFQQGDYAGAIEVFLDAYSQFPNAQKAPDMLLKTGMALRKINERDAACATYEELLEKFPNASSGVREKVRSEIKSAQC